MTIAVRSRILKKVQLQIISHTPKQEGEAEEAKEGPEDIFIRLSFTC